jgi:hypothetical protein
MDQRYFDWFGGLFSALWLEGRRQEAVDVLRTWSRAHPEDSQGAAWLQTYEDSLRILSGAPRRTPDVSPSRRGRPTTPLGGAP